MVMGCGMGNSLLEGSRMRLENIELARVEPHGMHQAVICGRSHAMVG